MGSSSEIRVYHDESSMSQSNEIAKLTLPPDEEWTCDFCHKENINEMWTYTCGDLVIEIPGVSRPIIVSASAHGACYECHQLIESDDYLRLVDRCLQGNTGLQLDMRVKLMEAYCNQFRAKRDPHPGTPVARYPTK